MASPSCSSPLPPIAEESAPSSNRFDRSSQDSEAHDHNRHHNNNNLRSRIISLCSRAASDHPGCRPLLGILSNLFLPCRRSSKAHQGSIPHSTSSSAALAEPAEESNPAPIHKELLDLSRRQQCALVDKQDTIDMLEWQLEQLHSMATKEREITSFCCRHKKKNSLSNRGLPGNDQEQDCCTQGQECVVGALKSRNTPTKNSPSFSEVHVTATELLLEMTMVRATLATRRFCKVFMKQMELSRYSVLRVLAELEPRTSFLKKEHTAFALESRVNKALFHCFENESFDEQGITSILDTSERALARLEEFQRLKVLDIADAVNPEHAAFEPEFLRFCENKTQDMWGLFPWSVVFKTPGERNTFTSAFINACKGVWLLHRLAYAMNPVASIIRVGRGVEANPVYVEPVVTEVPLCEACKSTKVEFMVMPGFRTLKKTVKCLVYTHSQCLK